MYEWYPSHPVYQAYLTRAHLERSEALSRAAYLTVVGADWLTSRTARALAAGLRRVARAYGAWSRRRLTIRALSRLDERMLRDIGIDAPGTIEAIATELVQGKPAAEPRPAPRLVPVQPRLVLDCPDLKHAA
jgi:uncharacterized protein YjiS (DUF1127 family)